MGNPVSRPVVGGSRSDDEAETTLLLDSGAAEGRACSGLLHAPGATNHLLVTYTQSADGRVRDWRRGRTDGVANLAIVAVGDLTRSTGSADVDAGPVSPITGIADPTDLSALGRTVSRRIDAWEHTDATTVVCFDSLDMLVRHVGARRTYKFLHVLTARLSTLDARAHFHLSRHHHDDETVTRLASLCDSTLDATDAAGSPST